MSTKICIACQKELPFSDFPKHSMSADGCGHKCKKCRYLPSNYTHSQTNTYVYVMQAENGMIKIGVAGKVNDRLANIRAHSPINIELVAQAFRLNAGEFESKLHLRYIQYHHHNEWFSIPAHLIPDLIKEVQQSNQEKPEPIKSVRFRR